MERRNVLLQLLGAVLAAVTGVLFGAATRSRTPGGREVREVIEVMSAGGNPSKGDLMKLRVRFAHRLLWERGIKPGFMIVAERHCDEVFLTAYRPVE